MNRRRLTVAAALLFGLVAVGALFVGGRLARPVLLSLGGEP
jgi:hypothetical protein